MAPERYRAVVFDLLTALLDSWSLWNAVAGGEPAGLAWRRRYLELTYRAGPYRPYEGIIAEAAADAGVAPARARALVERWGELEPWPEARPVLSGLAARVPVAVATNSSVALARIAVASLGVALSAVVTAQEAGHYKPAPEPYRMALARLGCPAESTLFVAGSTADVPGAAGVGMAVYWHNRRHLPPVSGDIAPRYAADSLWGVLDLV